MITRDKWVEAAIQEAKPKPSPALPQASTAQPQPPLPPLTEDDLMSLYGFLMNQIQYESGPRPMAGPVKRQIVDIILAAMFDRRQIGIDDIDTILTITKVRSTLSGFTIISDQAIDTLLMRDITRIATQAHHGKEMRTIVNMVNPS